MQTAAATVSPAGIKALKRAAARERGNICPAGLIAAAETKLLEGLDRRGMIEWDGGVPNKGAPRISARGRAYVASLPTA